jgi:hypothetical protein
MDINYDDIELFEANEAFGPFAQRKPLKKTLETAEKKLRRRCRSVEACNEVLAQIKDEASTFNSHLKAMQNIAKELESGQIDKATAKKQVAPHFKALKKASDLVNYGQVVQNKTAVSEDDIKFVRDYIKGLNGIVQQIKAELKNPQKKASFLGDAEANEPDFDFDVEPEAPIFEGFLPTKEERAARAEAKRLYKEAGSIAKNIGKEKDLNKRKAIWKKAIACMKKSYEALPEKDKPKKKKLYDEIIESWSWLHDNPKVS